MTPVSFTNRYGALLHGDVFRPCRAPATPTPARSCGSVPRGGDHDRSVQGSERHVLVARPGPRRARLRRADLRRAGPGTSETFPHQGDPRRTAAVLQPVRRGPQPASRPAAPACRPSRRRTSSYGTQDAIDFFPPPRRRRTPTRAPAAPTVDGYNPLLAALRPLPRPAYGHARPDHAARDHRPLAGRRSRSPTCRARRRVEAVVALDKLTGLDGAGGAVRRARAAEPVVPGAGRAVGVRLHRRAVLRQLAACSTPGGLLAHPAPDPRRERETGFDGWKRAGVDSMVIVPRASTHLEYTDIAYVLPASRYGQDLSSHYTQAWLASTCSTIPRRTSVAGVVVPTTWSRGIGRVAAGHAGPRRTGCRSTSARATTSRRRPAGRPTTTSRASAAVAEPRISGPGRPQPGGPPHAVHEQETGEQHPGDRVPADACGRSVPRVPQPDANIAGSARRARRRPGRAGRPGSAERRRERSRTRALTTRAALDQVHGHEPDEHQPERHVERQYRLQRQRHHGRDDQREVHPPAPAADRPSGPHGVARRRTRQRHLPPPATRTCRPAHRGLAVLRAHIRDRPENVPYLARSAGRCMRSAQRRTDRVGVVRHRPRHARALRARDSGPDVGS